MQKFGQIVVFLLVFAGVAALLYFVAAPKVLPPAPAANAPLAPPTATVSKPVSERSVVSTDAPASDTRIAPPRSAAQREADDIEARRAPYYQWLHSKFGNVLVAQQPNPSDTATLDLYTSRSDRSLILPLVAQAVQPYADQYGFNHVRIFQPNPPTEVERYRFAAEANPDRNGKWSAFEK